MTVPHNSRFLDGRKDWPTIARSLAHACVAGAFSLTLLSATAAAADASIPVTSAGESVPIVNTAPLESAPPKKAPRISDPVLSIIDKLHDRKKNDGESPATGGADVVELGDSPDVIPAASARGKWDVAAEERAGGVETRDAVNPPRHEPVPGDPEFVRHPTAPDDAADEGAKTAAPAAAPKPFTPRRDDPELTWRRIPEAAAETDDGAAATSTEAESREPRAVRLDRPRFRSGEGLDSDAAEIVSEMALQEQKKDESAKESGALPSAPTSALARVQARAAEKNGHAEGDKPAPPATAAATAAAAAAAAKKQKKDPKKPEKKIDPEQAYNEAIAQIEKDKPRQEKILEEARKQYEERRTKFGDLRPRDDRAAMVLDVLSRKAELGTISGRVIDGATKQPVCARVRLVDMTDVAVDAPLPEGFWTNGEFTAQPLAGLAKIEITRGRFRPMYVERIETHKALITPFEKAVACPPDYDFAAKGWYLADLNIGAAAQRREQPVWMGPKPNLSDLVRAAQAEGIQILGVPAPWSDGADANDIAALKAFPSAKVLLLPLFAGPEHPFHGCAMGLGVRSVKGLPAEISDPEIPLRETFEDIRARGGLGVFSLLGGLRTVNIRTEIFPLFPRLEAANYFGTDDGSARLYGAFELPFDTVAGPAYDLLAFDGSQQAERLWFNLLDHGYPVSIIGAGGGSLEGGRIPYGQTFINLTEKPRIDNVLQAVKAGKTVVSFGPAAFCKIAERDMGPGSILPADGRKLTLSVQAFASLANDMQLDKIEVIRNGVLIHTHTVNDGETEIHQMAVPVSETSAAWYVVRVTERPSRPDSTAKGGTAWTSPIFFRGAGYSAPTPARSKITGVLRVGATPTAGTVKAVVPGQPDHLVQTDANGRFTIDVPAAGTLIFEAPHAEPVAKRIFEHPKIQQAIGALQSDRSGRLTDQFDRAALFGAWTLLLSELDWDITLTSIKN